MWIKTKKILRLPIYPILFSLYPVLSLLAYNLGQVSLSAGVRSLLVSLAASVVLLLVFRGLTHDGQRAAFITAAWLLLFYTFGQVYNLIAAQWKTASLENWMLGVWLVLAMLALAAGLLRKLHFQSAALPLNIVSLGLLIYPLVLLVSWSIDHARPVDVVTASQTPALHVPADETLPDIYYIMPEDYGRADLLQSMDQIDIRQFMDYLKTTGFYVASCSQSNYGMSELSLGSALNMNYLQAMSPEFNAENLDQNPIWNAIRYSAVTAGLKTVGYKTVAFATGFAWSELTNSDLYLAPSAFRSDLNAFEIQLLRTTPVRKLEDDGLLNLTEIDGDRYRERTMLVFDSAARLAALPGPKFVFMHIISPHEPFVFDAEGNPIDPAPFMNAEQLYTEDQYIRGYRDQVPFVNMMLEKTITTLITKSTRPLVILLQTDTGPLFTTGADTFKILNAYYMPGHTAQLYAGISPVNSFRVVFNSYLGTQLPLLDDVSYASPVPHIYDFSAVANPCTNP